MSGNVITSYKGFDKNMCGSETLVVRTDSQSWIRDIKCLKHANIDGREMVIID